MEQYGESPPGQQGSSGTGNRITRRRLLQGLIGLPAASAATVWSRDMPETEGRILPTLPAYDCRKVRPFQIDGDLHKAIWNRCRPMRLVPSTGNRQRLQPTIVRACWSDTHLYACFHCVDFDAHSTFTQRDEPLYDQDVAEIFLCPTGELRNYFELEFSPHAVIWDGLTVNPGLGPQTVESDPSWTCEGLQCLAHIERAPKGSARPDRWWSVEVAVPFKGLAVPVPVPGDRWRANFYRIDYTTPAEYSAWSPTFANPPAFHVPTRFGWLRFNDVLV